MESSMAEAESGLSPTTFEIGLVMAGAVSAGAYTAGVIDFLTEALDSWYRAKQRGVPDTPPHDVKISVVTGASAGGVTAAVLASELRGGLLHMNSQTGSARNKLYETWVERVDIGPLLDARDLERPGAKVPSLLDSTVLDDAARNALATAWSGAPWPEYMADPLDVILCVTNLRGVPYSIRFSAEQDRDYGMSQHADYMHFSLSPTNKASKWNDSVPLGRDDQEEGNWRLLKEAALASSAFPAALAARSLTRSAGNYNRRRWSIPQEPKCDRSQRCVCEVEKEIPPMWPDELKETDIDRWEYRFANIDGGLANNEPFEIARRCLAGSANRSPRGAEDAKRAILMIDPFPNQSVLDLRYDPESSLRLLGTLPALISAVLSELRFKKDELELARDPSVFSRFLIAPTRTEIRDGKEQRARYPLATGGLGGFAGFLSEAYRQHDYRLGRRNCQQFLRRTFGLAYDNPLFRDWPPTLKEKLRFKNEAGMDLLPIIPLTDSLGVEEPLPEWPVNRRPDMKVLERLLRRRTDAVVKRLIDTELERLSMNWIVSRVGWEVVKLNERLLNLIRSPHKGPIGAMLKIVRDDLSERGL
jgi:hypothetical protein